MPTKRKKRNSTGPRKDLTGQKFNRLTVLGLANSKRYRGCYLWKCKCECGNIKETIPSFLHNGSVQSCGCLRSNWGHKMIHNAIDKRRKDRVGQKFGKWTVISRANTEKYGSSMWLCKCECGTERIVHSSGLTSDKSRSCGCVRKNKLKTTSCEVGSQFNYITIIQNLNDQEKLCRCICGKHLVLTVYHFKYRVVVSCGCKNKEILIHKLSQETWVENVDFTNIKMGQWVVVGPCVETVGKKTLRKRWLCQCKCGKTQKIEHRRLVENTIKECSCVRKYTNKSFSYQGLNGAYFNRIAKSAQIRNLEFTITIGEMWDLFVKQNCKCALTGCELILPPTSEKSGTASLDRIDSTKGYVVGNVQWVHKSVNMMKQSLPNHIFIDWCQKIAKHQG